MGIKSEGMVLASRDESGLSLIRPEHRKEWLRYHLEIDLYWSVIRRITL